MRYNHYNNEDAGDLSMMSMADYSAETEETVIVKHKVHPFTKSGCGLPPFRVVDFYVDRGPKHYNQNGVTLTVGSPGQPMGTCDHCGTGIANVYVVEASEGNRFNVGCECVKKTGDIHLHGEVKRIKRSYDRKVKEIVRRKNRHIMMRDCLRSNSGLGEALKCDHHIVKGIRKNFITFGNITERQIELVFKLHNEAKNPETAEKFIPVPSNVFEGRVRVEGTIVSTKVVQDFYGQNTKMLVKVSTPEGAWKTWGTVPSNLDCWDMDNNYSAAKGNVIAFDAKFKKSDRDNTFSFFSRPTKAVVVKQTEGEG